MIESPPSSAPHPVTGNPSAPRPREAPADITTLMRPLILASTSPFRAALLARIGIKFQARPPIGADETARPGESVVGMVERLARLKAETVARAGNLPDGALIIGSDQSAEVDGHILHKPGNFERARDQLRALSEQTVTFYTGLALLDTGNHRVRSTVESFAVTFRPLDDALIERYLHAEQPYQSVGAFKSEGMGIVLFQRLVGDDPNTLVGLPLIRLTDWLLAAGCAPLSSTVPAPEN